MRLHFIQHVAFERPAGIASWARRHDFPVSVTKIYRPPLTARAALPAIEEFDTLVVLGGPMGVDDTDEHPWLAEEIPLIQEAIAGGRRVIGVCLGAQLIAKALGADVRRARFTEIGWFAVHREKPLGGMPDPFDGVLPEQFPAFHWHSDTFDVPETAKGSLSSEACGNQAFVVPGRALAIQFHLEMEMENIEALLENCASELGTGRYVQTPDQIREGTGEHGALTRALLDRILDWFLLDKLNAGDVG